jgi:hypothetical protein
VIASRNTTGVNELSFLAVTQGAVLNQTLGNGSITEGLIDLTRKEFQKKSFSIASLVSLAELSKSCSHDK